MPTNATTAILFADEGPMQGSLVPVCLEKILGDEILLWQLRALPKEINHVHVIAGENHKAVARLLADYNAETGDNIECRQDRSVLHSILGLAEKCAIELGAGILFMQANRPLINNCAIKSLLNCGNGATLDGCKHELGVLEWSLIAKAAERLVQQNPEADSKCLLSMVLPENPQAVVGCGRDNRLCAKTRRDLAKIHDIARKRIVASWLDTGVAFIDKNSTYIGPRVTLADRGVTIEPHVRMEGRVIVGEGTTIGQGSIVRDSTLGASIEVKPYCEICGTSIGDGARIGPFARLREGSRIDSNAHVGNFVETKKTHMQQGAKANHLTYLGDCEVGENTNVGAGCITCNYDGYGKHRTVIGKNVFIGSDCQLVAPVTVGDGAVLAAGTTLTADAPKDALVLTRPETTIKEGGASKLRAKKSSR